jgi:hypothetical protein
VAIGSIGLDEFVNFVKVYPNPNSGVFTLQFDHLQGEEAALRVLNSSGKLVYTSMLTQTKTSIDLGDLASGLYLVEITNGTNVIFQKIQIR